MAGLMDAISKGVTIKDKDQSPVDFSFSGLDELCEALKNNCRPLRYAWFNGKEYDTSDHVQSAALRDAMKAEPNECAWFYHEPNTLT